MRYVSLVALVAVLGGVSMASVAGARRTESSFPTYLAGTNPSTLGVFTRYVTGPILTGYDPSVARKVARLPLVERATSAIIFDANINLEGIKGVHPHVAPGESPPTFIGSFDGEFTSVDRVTVVHGRMFRSSSPSEAIMNVQAAKEVGAHIGQVFSLPFFTDAQILSSNDDTIPSRIVKVKLVGEFVTSQDVVESDIESLGDAAVIFSPALTRELSLKYATGTDTYLQIRGGDRNAKKVLNEVDQAVPVAVHFPSEITSGLVPIAQQSISPQAGALAIFGAVAALALFLISALVIGRVVRMGVEEFRVLRAMGASHMMLLADQLIPLIAAIAVGSLLAVVVAVALSPLAPLGPVRPIYPHPGVAFDWIALGGGCLLLLIGLGAIAIILARGVMRGLTRNRGITQPRGESRPLRAVMNLGLPIAATMGLRFALDSGRGRNISSNRSTMLGAVLAVTVLVGTVTFGASLDSLVSRPALYGWNWNYAIIGAFAGDEDLPAPQIDALLNHDHDIMAWSGANSLNATLDQQEILLYTEPADARVAPTLLSGHEVKAANQVVLGVATLNALHKRIGDTVELNVGGPTSRALVVVGTATMPSVSKGGGLGQGAVVATSDVPAALLNLQGNPIPGPNMVLIRMKPDVSSAAAHRSLQTIVNKVNAIPAAESPAGGVIGALRPAEIVNFRSMETTPTVLAGVLVAGTLVALGLSLTASVRRRRRDLALLKTLGFTQRQLALSVAWQSSVVAVVGVAVGIPLGVAVGRELWILFARNLDTVPSPTVPALTLTLVGVGALVFANLVAAIPERVASRTPAALVLRAD
jgi:hypothetical protein